MTAFANPIAFRSSARSFAPTIRSVAPGMGKAERVSNDPDRSFPRRAEAALDRLLRDIERLEETERWDGMS